jgi:hypothetical protein
VAGPVPQLKHNDNHTPGIILPLPRYQVAVSMPSKVDQLRAKADECRAFGAAVKDDAIRLQLLGIAEEYDRLVEQNERLDKPPQRPGETASRR